MVVKEKNLSIETLRGLAIVLVVIGHVIGSAPDGGMKIDFPSPWRYLYIWIDYIQMPLFTAIAGWVYAFKPIGERPIIPFLYNKVKRLLIPMASVATLYFLIQYITPGTNNKEVLSNIWRIYIFPYTIFWYLQSLFLIFIMVTFAEKCKLTTSIKGMGVMMIIAYFLYIAQISLIPYEIPNIFAFKGAFDQLPYFIAGMLIQRFSKQLYTYKYIYIILALIGIALLQMKWIDPLHLKELYKCLLPIWIISGLIIILNQQFSNKLLIYFGAYAYSIYLFHGFGTAGGRIILSYFGIYNLPIVFVSATIIAIFVPIIADMVLSKNKWTARLFLGKLK